MVNKNYIFARILFELRSCCVTLILELCYVLNQLKFTYIIIKRQGHQHFTFNNLSLQSSSLKLIIIVLFFAPGHDILSIFLPTGNGFASLDLTRIGYTFSIWYYGNDENLKLIYSQNYGGINWHVLFAVWPLYLNQYIL